MRKTIINIIIVVIAMQLTSCANNSPPMYKSSQKMNSVAVGNEYELISSNVTHTLSNWWLLYIPVKLSIPNERVEDKLTHALLNKYSGELLTNVQIEKSTFFTIYWNVWSYKITADVWRKKA